MGKKAKSNRIETTKLRKRIHEASGKTVQERWPSRYDNVSEEDNISKRLEEVKLQDGTLIRTKQYAMNLAGGRRRASAPPTETASGLLGNLERNAKRQ